MGKLASLYLVTPLTTLSALGLNYRYLADSALQGQHFSHYTTFNASPFPQKLLQSNSTPSFHKPLLSGYNKLMTELGSAFKVLAVYPAVMKEFLCRAPPPGFYRDFDGRTNDVSEPIMDVQSEDGK